MTVALERFVWVYTQIEIEGCSRADGSDQLLFQWGGPFAWNDSFSIYLIRKIRFPKDHGGRRCELQLEFHYDPGQVSMKPGGHWLCGTDPEKILQVIRDSPCVVAASSLPWRSSRLDLYEL